MSVILTKINFGATRNIIVDYLKGTNRNHLTMLTLKKKS